jgi:outer membrane receptor protein involved in Fe transport
MRFKNSRIGSFATFAALLVLAAVSTTAAFAQSAGTGALVGTITDGTGATVPNASVTITNSGTNRTRTATTGSDGAYRFNLIEIGQYSIKISASGFKTSEVTGITVNVAETPVVNKALEVGAQSDQVTVEASAETLQLATSTLGTTVTARTVTQLPLSSRNYTQVLALAAGASVGVNNATSFGKGTQDISVNGNNPGQNNFQMDGVAINNIANNGSSNDAGIYGGIAVPNPDALQEFKIQTSTYDASYGRNPGANVNVVTKSGTNALHGAAWEFFRNSKLNANDFFYNRDNPNSRTAKQVLNQNQFGFTLGGPIKKDKLFFFGSYQGTRQKNGIAPQGNTTGAILPSIPGGDRNSAQFVRDVIAANCNFPTFGPALSCAAGTISGPALKILQLKTADGSFYIPTSGGGQRSFSIPAINKEDQFLLNGDYNINQKHTLAMRFFTSKNPRDIPLTPLVGGNLPGTPQTTTNSNTNSVLKLTTVVSSTFLNELRGSFQRNVATSVDAPPPGSSPAELGIKPLVSSYKQPPPLSFLINNFTLFGTLNPSFSPTNQIQFADQISWTKGKHTIRAGGEYERTQWNLVFGGLGRGWMFMGSFSDLLAGGPGNLLTCLFCVRGGPDGIIHAYRLPNQYLFAQDDWKVSSKLTVNLGVRWEHNGTLSDKYGNLTNTWLSKLAPNSQVPNAPLGVAANYAGFVVPSNFDSRTWGTIPNGVFASDKSLPLRKNPPLSNFGPRLGFAYQVSSKLVVRGGFGLFYDRVGMDRFVHSVQEGNPYAATVQIAPTATIADPYPATPSTGSFAQRWANFQTGATSGLNRPFMNEVISTPLTRQFNINFQYEIAPSWVAEVGYVGANGINLTDYNHNYNTAAIATPGRPVNGLTTTTVANRDLRTPYLGFVSNGLQGTAYDGISNYNSLQTTLRKQFSKGFTMQAAYTFSKSLTNIANSTANSNLSTDLRQQYGPSNFNRPHRLVINYSWDVPFAPKGGIAGKVLDGWNVSGVTTIQAGLPLTLIDQRGGTAYTATTTGYENGYSRAQMCAGKTYENIPTSGDLKSRLGGNSGGPGFFNTSAFCAPRVIGDDGVATDFGNAGVGILSGPGQFNFDFAALKNFKPSERTSLQFRAEFFNLFNHAQFSNPSSTSGVAALINVGSPTSGFISSTSVNPRIVQFGLKLIF